MHQGWTHVRRAPLDTALALLVFLCANLRQQVWTASCARRLATF